MTLEAARHQSRWRHAMHRTVDIYTLPITDRSASGAGSRAGQACCQLLQHRPPFGDGFSTRYWHACEPRAALLVVGSGVSVEGLALIALGFLAGYDLEGLST